MPTSRCGRCGYRTQGASYAIAVEHASGEPVARVVFVYLTAAGPIEQEIDDLALAVEEVRALLEEPAAMGSLVVDPGDPIPA